MKNAVCIEEHLHFRLFYS